MTKKIPRADLAKLKKTLANLRNADDLSFKGDQQTKHLLAAYALDQSGVKITERHFSRGSTVTEQTFKDLLDAFDIEYDQQLGKQELAHLLMVSLGIEVENPFSTGSTVTRTAMLKIADRFLGINQRLPVRKVGRFASDIHARADKILGTKGEEFVLEFEKKRLADGGASDLAKKVSDVSRMNCGYDIFSYEFSGRNRLIEVKTTQRNFDYPFYISRNELNSSYRLSQDFWLYRVFNFKNGSGDIKCLQGDLNKLLALEGLSFRAQKSASTPWGTP